MDNKDIADKLNSIALNAAAINPEPYTIVRGFKPHDWVKDAMRQAFIFGQQDAQAKHDFIQTQADSQYREARTSEIRAMTAAIMEAVGSRPESHILNITISLAKLASVWERWDYTTTSVSDDLITITITKKD